MDSDLARFPTSIEDALLAPENPDVPEAPALRVRPRVSAMGLEPVANGTVETAAGEVTAAGEPLYFQCPACRSTLCVPSGRLGERTPAPCGHCSKNILPPMLFEREPKPGVLPPRRSRFGPLR